MTIKVKRNAAGNCINFIGSSNPAYWNACISAEVDTDLTGTVNVINDIRTVAAGTTQYEFFQVPFEVFTEADGTAFASAADCAAYITAQANVATNTGQFVLSATDTIDFSLDSTGTTILLDNGDAYAVNALRAISNDDNHINIMQHTGDTAIFTDLRVANASIDGVAVSATLATAVNELNALFQQSGGATGDPPVITSATTVNLTEGDTLNYELVATNGVAYEWTNLPSGVATVEGSQRKIIGGSGLTPATYTITAKAINYFGEDTEDIDVIVSAPVFANTKSVQFYNYDYLGANAAQLDATLGRTGNGAGSGDAWTIAFWFKPSTDTTNQTIFYYGSNDIANSGFLELRYVPGSEYLRFRYGSNNNYIQLATPTNSLLSGTWSHAMITYDGGTTGASSGDLSNYYSRFEIFIDGVSQTTSNSHSNYGWTDLLEGQNLRVGRFKSGNNLKDGAKVEELAVWDSDQTANVADIYNSGSTHDLSSLTASPTHWWRMGDGDTYPNIQDNVGSVTFVMYNMTAADIVTDAP